MNVLVGITYSCVRLIIYIRAFVPARRAVKKISIKRLKTSWTMIVT